MQLQIRQLRNQFQFVPGLIHLALPIALQGFMTTALNLADTVMVGQLGAVQIGAIALGNQIFFLLVLFQFGVGSGCVVFASQFWGNGNIPGVRQALGASLIVAIGGALVFTAGAVLAPELLLRAFTTDPAVIAEGTPYLRIVGVSYVFTAISMGYTHGLRSVGDTRLPMYATGVSIGLNILGNYVLIFGALGLPALGVRGAAIATAAARVIETAIILGVVYRRRGPIAASLRDLVVWPPGFLRRFLRRATPVVANELLWATGFTMYTVVFARMGTEFLAAYNIADTMGRLLMVIFIASGQATAVLIGNEIGAGRRKHAGEIGAALIRGLPVVAIVVGLVGFLVVAPIVPRFFAVDAEVRLVVRQLLRLFSVLLAVKTINLHIIVGILRGGADTTFALVIDIVPLWLIGVPAAAITGLVLDLPAALVYLAMNTEEITRLVFGLRRVRSGRWIHDLTGTIAAPVPDRNAAGAPPIRQPSAGDADAGVSRREP